MRDVAVIGGGPGGSTTAILLAAGGHDTVLFERERFPCFHIGESLLPHNMRLFERLGLVEPLRRHFIEKWGVEFLSSDGALSRLFHFDEALEPRHPMCFQVPRAEFDLLLLRHAASRGAEVREEAAVYGRFGLGPSVPLHAVFAEEKHMDGLDGRDPVTFPETQALDSWLGDPAGRPDYPGARSDPRLPPGSA